MSYTRGVKARSKYSLFQPVTWYLNDAGSGLSRESAVLEKRPTRIPSTIVPRYHCHRPLPLIRNSSLPTAESQVIASTSPVLPFSSIVLPFKAPAGGPPIVRVSRVLL